MTMDNIITTLIYPMLRKWLTGAAGAWIAILIEKGVLTQPQVDTVIQAVCAVALFAGAALWTWVKNKLAKGKAEKAAMKCDLYTKFSELAQLLAAKEEKLKVGGLPEFELQDFRRVAAIYGVNNV